MFKTIRFAAVAAAASLLAAPALAQGSPVVGVWNTEAVTDFGTFKAVMTVAEANGAHTIEMQDVPQEGAPPPSPSTISEVVVDGPRFAFKRKLSSPMGEILLTYSGTVEGNTLTADVGSDFGPIKLTGTRQ
jgi:hypothetical protein